MIKIDSFDFIENFGDLQDPPTVARVSSVFVS